MKKWIYLVALSATAVGGFLTKESVSAPEPASQPLSASKVAAPVSATANTSESQEQIDLREALRVISQKFNLKVHLEILQGDNANTEALYDTGVILPKGKYSLETAQSAIQKQLPDITWHKDGQFLAAIASVSWSSKNPLDEVVGFDGSLDQISYDNLVVWLYNNHPTLSVGPTIQWDGRPEYLNKASVTITKNMTYRQVLENWFETANLSWEVAITLPPISRIVVREKGTGRVLSSSEWPKGKTSMATFSSVPHGDSAFEPQTAEEIE